MPAIFPWWHQNMDQAVKDTRPRHLGELYRKLSSANVRVRRCDAEIFETNKGQRTGGLQATRGTPPTAQKRETKRPYEEGRERERKKRGTPRPQAAERCTRRRLMSYARSGNASNRERHTDPADPQNDAEPATTRRTKEMPRRFPCPKRAKPTRSTREDRSKRRPHGPRNMPRR